MNRIEAVEKPLGKLRMPALSAVVKRCHAEVGEQHHRKIERLIEPEACVEFRADEARQQPEQRQGEIRRKSRLRFFTEAMQKQDKQHAEDHPV